MSPMTRRSFYLGAAAAFSAVRVMGANDRIHVGVVGIGGRGREHVRLYSTIEGAQVTAICDVNQAARERVQANIEKAGGVKALEFSDMRELFGSNAIDAVSIATPNHWHALACIWACEAGKDVYVEKPASHNIHESFRMVEVARKTQRMVQVGMQSRSTPHKMRAIQTLRDGVIGTVYGAKGLCFKRRKSIGKTPLETVPLGLDWSLFLGPAQMKEYSKNRFAYNWHWFWDTGNGDIGNQGVHEMDICRWGLGDAPFPRKVASTGGKYVYDDDQETPNTQLAKFQYPGREIMFEVRGLPTGPEAGVPVRPGNLVGNLFFGSDGWMWLDDSVFQVYRAETNEKVIEYKSSDGDEDGTSLHMKNFLTACRSRNRRVGRMVEWDEAARRFTNDPGADALLTRDYRKPYVV